MPKAHRTRALNEPTTPSEVLGAVIRARRIELGLAQADLEGDADFHQTYVSMIEHGKREPRLSALIHLERALRLPPGELLRRVRVALEGTDEPGGDILQ